MSKGKKRASKRSGKKSSGGPPQSVHTNKYAHLSQGATLAASQRTFRAGHAGSPRARVPTFRDSFSYR